MIRVGVVVLVATVAAALGVGGEAPGAATPEMKLRLVEEINRDRKAAGLRPVEYSEELSRAADEHCRDMITVGYLSHWNPAGWKPYLRYTQLGIRDYTAENLWSLWDTTFHNTSSMIEDAMLRGHHTFMAQSPPQDGHKQNVLNEHHTHVGIGVAYDGGGLRLLELFAARYAELKPLPLVARLDANLFVEGRVTRQGYEPAAISIYYEPPPKAMNLAALRATGSYGLPAEEQTLSVAQSGWPATGNNLGPVEINGKGGFRASVRFWKKRPGVYTVSVWVRQSGDKVAFIGAQQSVIIEDEAQPIRPHGPRASAPPPGAR